MKKIDTALAQECVDLVGEEHRVPFSPAAIEHHPIQEALDNFDFLHKTVTGKGPGHDTVWVIFQNIPSTIDNIPQCQNTTSTRPEQRRYTRFRNTARTQRAKIS